MSEKQRTRRGVLTALSTAGVVSLAGCSDLSSIGSDSDSNNGGNETDSDNGPNDGSDRSDSQQDVKPIQDVRVVGDSRDVNTYVELELAEEHNIEQVNLIGPDGESKIVESNPEVDQSATSVRRAIQTENNPGNIERTEEFLDPGTYEATAVRGGNVVQRYPVEFGLDLEVVDIEVDPETGDRFNIRLRNNGQLFSRFDQLAVDVEDPFRAYEVVRDVTFSVNTEFVTENGSVEGKVQDFILPKETIVFQTNTWGSLASEDVSEDDCGGSYSGTLTIEPEYDGQIEIEVKIETGGELAPAPASSSSFRTCSEMEISSYTVVENTV